MKQTLPLLVLLLSTACNEIQLTVRDTDTRAPLAGVRIVREERGARRLIGFTGADGRARMPAVPGVYLGFKNHYRPLQLELTTLTNSNLELLMTERTAPAEVKDVRIITEKGTTCISWEPSSSPDTAMYTIYRRLGLDPDFRKLAGVTGKTELSLPALRPGVDHHFKITATDRHGNENHGTLASSFHIPAPPALPATATIRGRVSGAPAGVPVQVRFHPVNLGDTLAFDPQPRRTRCADDGSFASPLLPAGRWTVIAFADTNGNGHRDGWWLGHSAEPVAIRGDLILPANGTVRVSLVLQQPSAGLPAPVFTENPGYTELHDAAWAFARKKIAAGNPARGFSPAYMDEGFNNHIYQWDTCFMMFFGMYGSDSFPALASIDNFYRSQHPNGYICRVRNEDTGGDYPPTLKDPHVNPPLFAWVEYTYWRQSGDDTRLLPALVHNHRYYRWLKHNIRTADGFYFTSNLGSGMDNSPREGKVAGWVDLTAQMALFARAMQLLAEAAGMDSVARQYAEEYRQLAALINGRMWDEKTGFYRDWTKTGTLHDRKTIAGYWPLVAGIADSARASALIRHLEDPREFGTAHLFPTLSKDEPEYDPKGYYWRGAVWAPTTFMVIKGLETAGHADFATRASRNHLDNMLAVFRIFKPDRTRLPYGHPNIPFPAQLDGTRQIWECYSPEKMEPATRWDNHFLVRPEFVGWSGVGPITLFYENVIGIRPDVPGMTIRWRVSSEQRHGIRNLPFGQSRIDLMMTAIRNGRPHFSVTSPVAFTLQTVYNGREKKIAIRAGSGTYH